MGVQIRWDNEEHTVLHFEMTDPWTWEQMHEAINTSTVMLDTVNHKAHFIFDLGGSHTVPSNALTQLRMLMRKSHPNSGASVIVGAQKTAFMRFARSLLEMAHKLNKAQWQFFFADTLDEARTILRQHINESVPLP